jgi:hypothetical protein
MTQQYLAGEFSLLLCLESLARGDPPAFDSQAASVARLREFGVCAGLLEDVELG